MCMKGNRHGKRKETFATGIKWLKKDKKDM